VSKCNLLDATAWQDHDGALDHGIVRPQQGTISFQNASLWPAVVRIARPDRLVPEAARCFQPYGARKPSRHGRQSPRRERSWTLERFISVSELEGKEEQLRQPALRGEQADARHRQALMTNPRLLILDEATRARAAGTAEIYARSSG